MWVSGTLAAGWRQLEGLPSGLQPSHPRSTLVHPHSAALIPVAPHSAQCSARAASSERVRQWRMARSDPHNKGASPTKESPEEVKDEGNG